ncbi:MAG: hypothetical protein IJ115_04695 [Erysipelotrichaceae bacterium]|nr:hypothetical protein [Erysipelotrichaceae bacterium]
MMTFMIHEESFTDSEHNEWYQFSKGICCEFDRKNHMIISLKMNGRPIEVATKAPNILEEYFKDHDYIKLDGEPRLIIHM